MNQRQNDFDCGHAQFVVAGPIRWRYSTDRGKARLALRSQVRVEDVDFGDHYFISIDAMGMDEITEEAHRRGKERGKDTV